MLPRQEIARRLAAARQAGLLAFAAFGLATLPLDAPNADFSAYFFQCFGLICMVGGSAVSFHDQKQISWRVWARIAQHRILLMLPAIGFLGLAIGAITSAITAHDSRLWIGYFSSALLGYWLASIWLFPDNDPGHDR